ncbi:MAG: hypothetical protein GC161_09045 [Planctomycetaceae bacterium]|nr:hypothetical protein [Planctomycetaceae bacterium]
MKLSLTTALLLPTLAVAAAAQNIDTLGTCQLPTWQPNGLAALERMGQSVAIQGNTALVGAPGGDRVFVYERDFSTWSLVQTLQSPLGLGVEFGHSVAIDGERCFVGAPGVDLAAQNAGAVHVFQRGPSQWTHLQAVLDLTPTVNGRFGHSVDASGGWIAVGAPGDGGTGRAHVLSVYGGNAVLLREFGQFLADDNFASAVALHRNVGDSYAQVFASNWSDDTLDTNAGSVWHVAVSGTDITYGGVLRPADLGLYDLFGYALDYDGEHLVVGARGNDEQAVGAGAAYIYDVGPTTFPLSADFAAKIHAPEAGVGDQFGYSVAVEGKRIAIGARMQEAAPGEVGKVHLFQPAIFGDTWVYDRTLEPTDGMAAQHFGSAVALGDRQVVVGSMYHYEVGFQAGAAYLFSTATNAADGGLCPSEHLTTAQSYGPNKSGPNSAPGLQLVTPAVPGQSALLRVDGLAAGAAPILLVGTAPDLLPFDAGHFLVANPLLIQMSQASLFGQVGVAWSVPQAPGLFGVPIYCQAFAIDPAAVGAFHTVHSRGLAIGVGH